MSPNLMGVSDSLKSQAGARPPTAKHHRGEPHTNFVGPGSSQLCETTRGQRAGGEGLDVTGECWGEQPLLGDGTSSGPQKGRRTRSKTEQTSSWKIAHEFAELGPEGGDRPRSVAFEPLAATFS